MGEGAVTVVELDTADDISEKYTYFTFGLLWLFKHQNIVLSV